MAALKGSILLTGANGALGDSIVATITSTAELAVYHCIYTVRNASTATTLKSTLANAPASHSYDIMSLDLSSLASVRRAATIISGRISAGEIPPIRAILLAAGYIEYHGQEWTEDGLDMSFVSNYLGHWLLTLMLLRSIDPEMGRIVILSSWSYNPSDTRNGPSPPKWKVVFQYSTEPVAKGTWSVSRENPSWRTGFRRYAAAKLCLVMMIGELQRRLDSDPHLDKISVLGIDPGAFASGIARRGAWPIRILFYEIILPIIAGLMTWLQINSSFRTRERAARDVLAAAFDCGPPLGERPKGVYLDGTVTKDVSAEARDPRKREMLWKDSIEYAHLEEGETSLVNWR